MLPTKTAIVARSMGNLRFVANAVEALGHELYTATQPDMRAGARARMLAELTSQMTGLSPSIVPNSRRADRKGPSLGEVSD